MKHRQPVNLINTSGEQPMKLSNATKEKMMTALFIAIILGAFGIVGEMDYQDAMMAEKMAAERQEVRK